MSTATWGGRHLTIGTPGYWRKECYVDLGSRCKPFQYNYVQLRTLVEREKKQKTKGNYAWDIKGVVKDFVLSCTIKTGLGDHKIEESPAN